MMMKKKNTIATITIFADDDGDYVDGFLFFICIGCVGKQHIAVEIFVFFFLLDRPDLNICCVSPYYPY